MSGVIRNNPMDKLKAAEKEYRDSLTPLRRAVYDLQCEMDSGLLIFGHHEISEEEIKSRLVSAMAEEEGIEWRERK